MIKLLYTEATKGCLRLFFLAGKRVLDYTHKALDNEKGLTKILRFIDNFVISRRYYNGGHGGNELGREHQSEAG